MNEQTVTIEWVSAEEYRALLNTWFLGVFTEDVKGTYETLEEAIEKGNEVQKKYNIEGEIKLKKN